MNLRQERSIPQRTDRELLLLLSRALLKLRVQGDFWAGRPVRWAERAEIEAREINPRNKLTGSCCWALGQSSSQTPRSGRLLGWRADPLGSSVGAERRKKRDCRPNFDKWRSRSSTDGDRREMGSDAEGSDSFGQGDANRTWNVFCGAIVLAGLSSGWSSARRRPGDSVGNDRIPINK